MTGTFIREWVFLLRNMVCSVSRNQLGKWEKKTTVLGKKGALQCQKVKLMVQTDKFLDFIDIVKIRSSGNGINR